MTDNLTGLQWEKKTNLDGTTNFADPHDADNVYTWCIDSGTPVMLCDNANAADGLAFTDFLRSLNGGACFSGQCDWRLPTRIELLTILAKTINELGVCTVRPCIDPIFGPTQFSDYWTATATIGAQNLAWSVHFDNGFDHKTYENAGLSVRAVRGGL